NKRLHSQERERESDRLPIPCGTLTPSPDWSRNNHNSVLDTTEVDFL
ncbi:unnamed protein product, partial [Musa hybrid cultivar]